MVSENIMRVRALITLLASLGLLFVMLPAAQADQVRLSLVSNPDGVFDPYLMKVTPLPTGSSTDMWLNCDALNLHITDGETWTADVIHGWDTTGLAGTLMSQLNMAAGSLFNQGRLTYDAAIAYDEKAWVELNYRALGFNNHDMSNAVWQIFDVRTGQSTNALYLAAVAAVTAGTGDSVNGFATYRNQLTIYSPDQQCLTCYQGVGGDWTDGIPQEFNAVPDGGVTLMLLGGAFVGLETLRRRFRV